MLGSSRVSDGYEQGDTERKKKTQISKGKGLAQGGESGPASPRGLGVMWRIRIGAGKKMGVAEEEAAERVMGAECGQHIVVVAKMMPLSLERVPKLAEWRGAPAAKSRRGWCRGWQGTWEGRLAEGWERPRGPEKSSPPTKALSS